MKPLFCSFFTPEYADEAAGLVASLNAHGLDHEVVAVPSLGSWVVNCGTKAAFLLAQRAAHPGRALVWLDADARVLQTPVLFDSLDCDIAYHARRCEELLSSTLYFGATPNADELMRLWQVECRQNPEEWDQRLLDKVVGRFQGLKATILPARYARIFDAADMGPIEETVIEQRQASRRLKKEVGP